MPDTGYTTILSNQAVQGADGQPIPNITVNMYVGQTSSNTGQYGRFVSVVTQAKDARGAQFVRRLELAQLLDLDPAQCVFVDDMAPNVAAAQACGMTALLHSEPDATAAALQGLLGVPLAPAA